MVTNTNSDKPLQDNAFWGETWEVHQRVCAAVLASAIAGPLFVMSVSAAEVTPTPDAGHAWAMLASLAGSPLPESALVPLALTQPVVQVRARQLGQDRTTVFEVAAGKPYVSFLDLAKAYERENQSRDQALEARAMAAQEAFEAQVAENERLLAEAAAQKQAEVQRQAEEAARAAEDKRRAAEAAAEKAKAEAQKRVEAAKAAVTPPEAPSVSPAPPAALAPQAPVAKAPAPKAARGESLEQVAARIPGYHSRPPVNWVSEDLGHFGVADWYNNTVYVAPRTPASKLYDVIAHEYAHILQVRAYGGSVEAAQAGMTAFYGGSGWREGAERSADCIAAELGATWRHYTPCNNAVWREGARRILAGQRL